VFGADIARIVFRATPVSRSMARMLLPSRRKCELAGKDHNARWPSIGRKPTRNSRVASPPLTSTQNRGLGFTASPFQRDLYRTVHFLTRRNPPIWWRRQVWKGV
jgi:hypothetical protein